MIAPEIPKNETERLKALVSYDLLDTLSEPEFDELTTLASEICGTEISLVSLVDQNRQWFKSKYGLEANETPRDLAFCAHAINNPNEILEVKNAKNDERFFDNPLVTGGPEIEFYAGVPLVNEDGYPLGTLCVIDSKARQLTKAKKQALQILAKNVINLIEIRRKNKQLRQTKKLLISKNEEVEQFAYHAAHDLKSPLNNILGLLEILSFDNTNLNEEQKSLLLKMEEVVLQQKQFINSLLEFSKASHHTTVETSKINLNVLVHRILDASKGGENCVVNINDNTKALVCSEPGLTVILQNLITNSIKYDDKATTQIDVTLTEDSNFYRFTFKDYGPGMPSNVQERLFQPFAVGVKKDKFGEQGTGLGLVGVKRTVESLGGGIEVASEKGEGVEIDFSIAKN